MNPELRRYVWTELTPTRLALTVLTVGLALSLASMADDMATVGQVGIAIYGVGLVWATLSAANAVSAEVAARSWDGQRMSALSAGALVWGKLIGAGALPSLIALAGVAAVGAAAKATSDSLWIWLTFNMLGALVCAQAVALFLDVSAAGRGRAASGLFRAGARTALALAVAAPFGLFLTQALDEETLTFWGVPVFAGAFIALNLWLYAGWATAGAWSSMRRTLGAQSGPAVWIGFIVFAMTMNAGIGLDWTRPAGWLLAAPTAAALAYAAAWTADHDVARLRGWLRALGRGDARTAWRLSPGWAWALLALAIAGGGAALDPPLQKLDLPQTLFDFQQAVLRVVATVIRDVLAIALLGLLLRRRAALATAATLLLAHLLIPGLLVLLDAPDGIVGLLSPFAPAPDWAALAPAATALVLLAVLALRALRPARAPR